MESNKVLLFICILLCCGIFHSKAQSDDCEILRNHVIIAFNWSPAPNPDYLAYSTDAMLAVQELSRFCVKDGLGIDRQVLSPDDYYSCVAFRAEVDKNTLQQFVKPIKQLEWIRNNEDAEFIQMIQKDWRKLILYKPFGNNNVASLSLLSLTKPYVLSHFLTTMNKKDVNRTFLILVSDHVFNGDMYNELIHLGNYNEQYSIGRITDEVVYPIYYAVNQSYFIRQLASKEIGYNYQAHNGYVELYEYIPLQRNFNLSSVFDYPEYIEAKRIRGKKYKCDLFLANRDNPFYTPTRLQLFLDDTLNQFWSEEDLSKNQYLTFKVKRKDRPLTVNLKAWVRLKDGVYNSTILSPSDRALPEAGRDGLNISIDIKYEKTATIFGIPMPDFLWFSFLPNNQYTAALIWEIIVIFCIMFAIYIFIRKKQFFVPALNEIKIEIEK